MYDFSGKVILITGATGGIGADIARAFHAAGGTVALSGTRAEALGALKAELDNSALSQSGDGQGASATERVAIFPCALSDAAATDALIPAVEEALGPLDVLISNAGITRDGLSMRMKDADFDDVLAVNLTASFRLARAAIKSMIRRRTGRIIAIASIVGLTGNAGQANYAASKAGLIGMAKSLAKEVASRSITVNCIAPGFIKSPMTDGLTDKQKEAILGQIPAARFGTGSDIAQGCLYLASQAGAYITGQTLHINGGMAMP